MTTRNGRSHPTNSKTGAAAVVCTTATRAQRAPPSMKEARKALRTVFGLSRLRAGQAEVIERVLAGQSTLAVMPTGAGKSLCYQLPAMLLDGCTLVVSPLISLMKDQCEKLRERGIAAVQFNSQLAARELAEAEQAVDSGLARIILATPERLADSDFIRRLQQRHVSLLAVDEAHCIAQWGHDFRPAFLELEGAVRALGSPTVLALTATAGGDVADEIMKRLHIPSHGLVQAGAFRENLHYAVEAVKDDTAKIERVLSLAATQAGSGIVYAATVKAAERVFDALKAAEIAVGLYHGKLAAAERRLAQDAFMCGDTRVMVATNAFGMGIDKADIRFVVHYHLPPSLEAYYQETGRAGRDGGPAACTLLFHPRDRAVQQFFLGGRYPSAEDLRAVHRQLLAPQTEGAGWTTPTLMSAVDRPRNKVQAALALLRQERVIGATRDAILCVRRPDVADDHFEAMASSYRARRAEDQAALERMVFYAQTGQCRWQVLLADLDATESARCGTCDSCRRIAAHEAAMASQIVVPDIPSAPQRAARLFDVEQWVAVKRYGRGIVVAADALSVTVAFDDGSRRCFQPGFVRPAAPQRALA